MPKTPLSQMLQFKASGWTFLFLPSSACYTVGPLMLSRFPSPEISTTGGTWSRVSILSGEENRYSSLIDGLHNVSSLTVR